MDEDRFGDALSRLGEILATFESSPLWREIVVPRDAVFARFQPIFLPSHLKQLSAEEFRPLLYFEQNHHWTGLHRQVNRICGDMNLLRQSLATLVDEGRPIAERFDHVADTITGMGKAIITAILTIAFPSKYGVWNRVSEGALLQLSLLPEFPRGSTLGERYETINRILLKLADGLKIDLWTLDALFWRVSQGEVLPRPLASMAAPSVTSTGPLIEASTGPLIRFGLERHLHDFLFDNWAQTTLGKDWSIFTEPGDPEAGYEYTCAVGRIDLLARHKTAKKWLVVELKRDDTTDSVVGQVLRYVGWVERHLAAPDDEVLGLIIARDVDAQLQYAIAPVPKLRAMTYKVEFQLLDPPKMEPIR
jgi:hypothetical protein